MLGHNALGSPSAMLLQQQACKQLPHLTKLDLSSNRISDPGGATLCHLLLPSASCALAFFSLAGNHSLGGNTSRKLAQALSYNTCLRDLNVSKVHLGEKSINLRSVPAR
jgi:hypothetical protein